MKFQTTRNELLNKLNFASKLSASKSLISALSGVLIEATETLNIFSTDLETSIKSTLKVKIIEEGRVVVPAKVFINILKSVPESKILFELNKETNQVNVICENANFKLNTLSIEEFPQFPKVKKINDFKIDYQKFKTLLSKVIIAASADESRIILTGVLIEISKNSINMVATDSYRLAIIEDKIDYDGDPFKVIIPKKVLENIIKSDFEGKTINLNIEENQVSFLLNNTDQSSTFIISRLLSGKFPDRKQLIPSGFKHNIIIKKSDILEVVRRISSISQDNIPIKLEMGDGKMNVSMNIKEIGSASESLDVSYAEENISIAFNPTFLIDGINMIDGDNVLFSIEEALKPVLFSMVDKPGITYLLMPIRIT